MNWNIVSFAYGIFTCFFKLKIFFYAFQGNQSWFLYSVHCFQTFFTLSVTKKARISSPNSNISSYHYRSFPCFFRNFIRREARKNFYLRFSCVKLFLQILSLVFSKFSWKGASIVLQADKVLDLKFYFWTTSNIFEPLLTGNMLFSRNFCFLNSRLSTFCENITQTFSS